MVEKQSNWHQNEPDCGNAFLFLAVLYGVSCFVSLCSVGLPPLHWVITTLKDYKVTKGEKRQIPSLAHGEVSSL